MLGVCVCVCRRYRTSKQTNKHASRVWKQECEPSYWYFRLGVCERVELRMEQKWFECEAMECGQCSDSVIRLVVGRAMPMMCVRACECVRTYARVYRLLIHSVLCNAFWFPSEIFPKNEYPCRINIDVFCTDVIGLGLNEFIVDVGVYCIIILIMYPNPLTCHFCSFCHFHLNGDDAMRYKVIGKVRGVFCFILLPIVLDPIALNHVWF